MSPKMRFWRAQNQKIRLAGSDMPNPTRDRTCRPVCVEQHAYTSRQLANCVVCQQPVAAVNLENHNLGSSGDTPSPSSLLICKGHGRVPVTTGF